MRSAGETGAGLISIVQGLAVVAILVTLAVGALAPAAGARQVEGAARALAGRMREAGVRAVTEQRSIGLVFAETGDGEPMSICADGDGDGVTRDDVLAGIDSCEAPLSLRGDHGSAGLRSIPWPSVAGLPPAGRRLTRSDPAVRFGASRMAVFTSDGDATPGSLTISDGNAHLCAIVVSGAGARVRALCYDRRADNWRER